MIKEVLIEQKVELEDLNVRGFIDLLIIDEEDRVYLYDIKTINAWSYKMKFGKFKKEEGSIHQELQLATYGIWAERKYGRVDGMFLLYYNKDNSMLKQVEVTNNRISDAISFWQRTNDDHKHGLPPIEENVSPVMDWECRYCEYKSKCQKDKGENK